MEGAARGGKGAAGRARGQQAAAAVAAVAAAGASGVLAVGGGAQLVGARWVCAAGLSCTCVRDGLSIPLRGRAVWHTVAPLLTDPLLSGRPGYLREAQHIEVA